MEEYKPYEENVTIETHTEMPKQDIKDELRNTTADVAAQIRNKSDSAIRSGQKIVADEMENICSALDSAAQRLSEKDDFMAGLAHNAAVKAHDMSDYVHNHDAREILSTANELAHKNPGVAIGGMFAAGIVLSRFLKSGQT